MTSIRNLDDIQRSIVDLVASKGITLDDLRHGWDEEAQCKQWSFGYKHRSQAYFDADFKRLLKCFELLHAAREAGDRVAEIVAILHAGIAAQDIGNFFQNLSDDCRKILCDDERFDWPKIPEGYQIPEHYEQKAIIDIPLNYWNTLPKFDESRGD